MNFPKFPVVFPQQGVTERLPSIGDRVHHARETIGTVEGFDEDGNWSKFIRFRQRLKCCMSEISIIVNSQGAYLFLGYLASQCDMQFHGSCERRNNQSQLLKVTSKWRCPMVRLPYGMRTNAGHPVVVKDCRSETEKRERVVWLPFRIFIHPSTVFNTYTCNIPLFWKSMFMYKLEQSFFETRQAFFQAVSLQNMKHSSKMVPVWCSVHFSEAQSSLNVAACYNVTASLWKGTVPAQYAICFSPNPAKKCNCQCANVALFEVTLSDTGTLSKERASFLQVQSLWTNFSVPFILFFEIVK